MLVPRPTSRSCVGLTSFSRGFSVAKQTFMNAEPAIFIISYAAFKTYAGHPALPSFGIGVSSAVYVHIGAPNAGSAF